MIQTWSNKGCKNNILIIFVISLIILSNIPVYCQSTENNSQIDSQASSQTALNETIDTLIIHNESFSENIEQTNNTGVQTTDLTNSDLNVLYINSTELNESSSITDINNTSELLNNIIYNDENNSRNSSEVNPNNTDENLNLQTNTQQAENTNNRTYYANTIINESSENVYINENELNNQLNTDLSETVNYNSNTNKTSNESNDENINETCLSRTQITRNDLSGRVVVEGFLSDCIIPNLIEVIDNSLTESEKIVTIKSPQHVNDSLTVYTDINGPSENERELIEVYLKSNNTQVEINNYLDTNNDGLIDRISWIVPHLSEMSYRVIIKFNEYEDSNLTNLEVTPISPSNGQLLQNPINFEFNFSYSNLSNVECLIAIDGNANNKSINIPANITNISWQHNLISGQHNWIMNCIDKNNSTISKSLEGNFVINDTLSLNIPNKVYLIGETLTSRIDFRAGEVKIELINPDNASSNLGSIIGPYPIEYPINNPNFTRPGLYSLKASTNYFDMPYFVMKNFSYALANISFLKTDVKNNENAVISFNITSPVEKITSVIVEDFGDSMTNRTYNNLNDNNFNINFYHKYSAVGNYSVLISTVIGGRMFQITKSAISVINSLDNVPPNIYMIGPNDNEIIRNSSVVFSYQAEDNVKIKNCTYELYNNSGVFGVLVYSRTDSNIVNNNTINIPMFKFDEGLYTWFVRCYDNSSNYYETDRDFTVDLPGTNTSLVTSQSSNNDENNNTLYYSQKPEVDATISALKDFLNKKQSFGPDQIEVINDLKISDELEYYNKRLLQIDQDLGNNVNFITDEAARQKRRQEILNEYDELKTKIPTDIKIIKQEEYLKNSITQNLDNILTEYFKSKNVVMDKKALEKLANLNSKLQKYIDVSTKVRQVEIDYIDRQEKITIITKKINLKNNSNYNILEAIPNDLITDTKYINFITEVDTVQNGSIYEFNINDTEDNKLVYYMNEFVEPKEIQKTDTVLFRLTNINEVGITGFSIFEVYKISFWSYIFIALFILMSIFYFITAFLKKSKVANWKKEENVEKIFDFIKEGKRGIKRNELETVREKYHKIRELFQLIPDDCKKYIYKDVEEMRVFIDKKDMATLVKEYDSLKKINRKEDMKRLYDNIKSTYKRLPKKDQKKIYEKMFKK